jgi:hypothetical protein
MQPTEAERLRSEAERRYNTTPANVLGCNGFYGWILI